MRRCVRHLGILAGALVLSGLVLPGEARANAVLDWNAVGVEATAAGGQNNVALSRTVAMVQLTMHDALNSLDRRYEAYLYAADRPFKPQLYAVMADAGTAADAAIAAAARDVLVSVIPEWGKPEQRTKALALVESTYTAALSKLPDGRPKKHGIAVGQAAAAAMLLARKGDGASAQPQYAAGTAPGKWRPHPNPVPAYPPISDAALAAGNWPAMLPQWGKLAPFTMVTPWQFRLPGPPALTSSEYARDYEEVKRLGGKESKVRTPAQSEIARYWYEGSPQGWSRIARVIANERKLDRWESARLLALLNAAIADGFIAGFDTRYAHDLWRPVTAIRAAETDGNDATVADNGWDSYLNTPPIPEYPSTHSVAGGAAATVLARFSGSDQVNFTMTSGAPFAGVTRTFTSF